MMNDSLHPEVDAHHHSIYELITLINQKLWQEIQ